MLKPFFMGETHTVHGQNEIEGEWNSLREEKK